MLSVLSNKFYSILRVIALVVVCLFTSTSIVSADLIASFSAYSPKLNLQNSLPIPPFVPLPPIHLNTDIGKIDNVYRVSKNSELRTQNSPFIYLIQDAHESLDAQENIGRILNQLVEEEGVSLVLFEGGALELDRTFYDFTSDSNLNKKVWKELFKQGEIGGLENYALRAPKETQFFGVEDEETYFKNIHTIQKVYELQSEAQQSIHTVDAALSKIRGKLFTGDLKKIYDTQQSFEKKIINLNQYTTQLSKWSKKILGLNLLDSSNQVAWPQLVRLLNLVELEKEVHRNKEVIEEALKLLRSSEFGVRSSSLSFLWDPSQHWRARGNLRWYFEYALDNGLIPESGVRSPHIRAFIGFHILKDELKSKDLFSELKRVEEKLLNALVKDIKVKEALMLQNEWNLLKKLFSLRLTRQEWKKLKANKGKWIFDTVSEETVSKMRLPASFLESVPDNFKFLYRAAFYNYELVEQRDQILSKRAVEHIKEFKPKKVALVTGGFHTSKIKQLLEDKNMGYAVISPAIRNVNHKLSYQKRIQTSRSTTALAIAGSLGSHYSKPYKDKLRRAAQKTILKFSAASLGSSNSITLDEMKKIAGYSELLDELVQPELLGLEGLQEIHSQVKEKFNQVIRGIYRYKESFDQLVNHEAIEMKDVRSVLRKDPLKFIFILLNLSSFEILPIINKLSSADLIGVKYFREAFRKNPHFLFEGLSVMTGNKNHLEEIVAVFRFVAQTPEILNLLRKYFVESPYNFLYAIKALYASIDKIEDLQKFVGEDGTFDVNLILEVTGQKLLFYVSGFAELNAVRGIIELLELKNENYDIQLVEGVSKDNAKKNYPNLEFLDTGDDADKHFTGKVVNVSIAWGAYLSAQSNLPLIPLKYILPLKANTEDKSFVRKKMRIAKNRKVILAISPTHENIHQLIEAYSKAYSAVGVDERPLIIFGLDVFDEQLKKSKGFQGFRTRNRNESDKREDGFLVAEGVPFGDLDVVVLNLRGEILELLKAADLAIIGVDRNIFEPASTGVPVLFFGNDNEWPINKLAKDLVVESGAATSIEDSQLAFQINSILTNQNDIHTQMSEGAKKAIERFDNEIIPPTRFYTSIFLAAAVLRNVLNKDKDQVPVKASSLGGVRYTQEELESSYAAVVRLTDGYHDRQWAHKSMESIVQKLPLVFTLEMIRYVESAFLAPEVLEDLRYDSKTYGSLYVLSLIARANIDSANPDSVSRQALKALEDAYAIAAGKMIEWHEAKDRFSGRSEVGRVFRDSREYVDRLAAESIDVDQQHSISRYAASSLLKFAISEGKYYFSKRELFNDISALSYKDTHNLFSREDVDLLDELLELNDDFSRRSDSAPYVVLTNIAINQSYPREVSQYAYAILKRWVLETQPDHDRVDGIGNTLQRIALANVESDNIFSMSKDAVVLLAKKAREKGERIFTHRIPRDLAEIARHNMDPKKFSSVSRMALRELIRLLNGVGVSGGSWQELASIVELEQNPLEEYSMSRTTMAALERVIDTLAHDQRAYRDAAYAIGKIAALQPTLMTRKTTEILERKVTSALLNDDVKDSFVYALGIIAEIRPDLISSKTTRIFESLTLDRENSVAPNSTIYEAIGRLAKGDISLISPKIVDRLNGVLLEIDYVHSNFGPAAAALAEIVKADNRPQDKKSVSRRAFNRLKKVFGMSKNRFLQDHYTNPSAHEVIFSSVAQIVAQGLEFQNSSSIAVEAYAVFEDQFWKQKNSASVLAKANETIKALFEKDVRIITTEDIAILKTVMVRRRLGSFDHLSHKIFRSAAKNIVAIAIANIDPENEESISRIALNVLGNALRNPGDDKQIQELAAEDIKEIVLANVNPKDRNSISRRALVVLEQMLIAADPEIEVNEVRLFSNPIEEIVMAQIAAEDGYSISEEAFRGYERILNTPGIAPEVYKVAVQAIKGFSENRIGNNMSLDTLRALGSLTDRSPIASDFYFDMALAVNVIRENNPEITKDRPGEINVERLLIFTDEIFELKNILGESGENVFTTNVPGFIKKLFTEGLPNAPPEEMNFQALIDYLKTINHILREVRKRQPQNTDFDLVNQDDKVAIENYLFSSIHDPHRLKAIFDIYFNSSDKKSHKQIDRFELRFSSKNPGAFYVVMEPSLRKIHRQQSRKLDYNFFVPFMINLVDPKTTQTVFESELFFKLFTSKNLHVWRTLKLVMRVKADLLDGSPTEESARLFRDGLLLLDKRFGLGKITSKSMNQKKDAGDPHSFEMVRELVDWIDLAIDLTTVSRKQKDPLAKDYALEWKPRILRQFQKYLDANLDQSEEEYARLMRSIIHFKEFYKSQKLPILYDLFGLHVSEEDRVRVTNLKSLQRYAYHLPMNQAGKNIFDSMVELVRSNQKMSEVVQVLHKALIHEARGDFKEFRYQSPDYQRMLAEWRRTQLFGVNEEDGEERVRAADDAMKRIKAVWEGNRYFVERNEQAEGNRYIGFTDNFATLVNLGNPDYFHSCQACYKPAYNRGLAGIIANGWNKAVVVYDDNGKFVARRIVRLRLTKKGEFILIKEPLYGASEYDGPIAQTLAKLAYDLTQSLGGLGTVEYQSNQGATLTTVKFNLWRGNSEWDYSDTYGRYAADNVGLIHLEGNQTLEIKYMFPLSVSNQKNLAEGLMPVSEKEFRLIADHVYQQTPDQDSEHHVIHTSVPKRDFVIARGIIHFRGVPTSVLPKGPVPSELELLEEAKSDRFGQLYRDPNTSHLFIQPKATASSLGDEEDLERRVLREMFWEAPLWFKVPMGVAAITVAAAILFGSGLPDYFTHPVTSFINNITIFAFFVGLADVLGQWISGTKFNLKQTLYSFFPIGFLLGAMTFVGYGIIDYLVPQDSKLPVPKFVIGLMRVLGAWFVIRARTVPYAWLVDKMQSETTQNLDAQEKQYESFWMSRVPSFIKNYIVMMFFPPHLAVIIEGIVTQYFQLFYSWSVNKEGFMIKNKRLRDSRLFLSFLGFIWWLGVQPLAETKTDAKGSSLGWSLEEQVMNRKKDISEFEPQDLVGEKYGFRYLESIRTLINPSKKQGRFLASGETGEQEPSLKTALYVGAGADISTALVLTGATELIFVDLLRFDRTTKGVTEQGIRSNVVRYLNKKEYVRYGLGKDLRSLGAAWPFMKAELEVMGAENIQEPQVDSSDSRVFRVEFVWKGIPRKLTYISETDGNDLDAYRVFLEPGLDVLMFKAGEYPYPEHHKAGLRQAQQLTDSITQLYLNKGGFVVVDHQTALPSKELIGPMLEPIDDSSFYEYGSYGYGSDDESDTHRAIVFKKITEASSLGRESIDIPLLEDWLNEWADVNGVGILQVKDEPEVDTENFELAGLEDFSASYRVLTIRDGDNELIAKIEYTAKAESLDGVSFLNTLEIANLRNFSLQHRQKRLVALVVLFLMDQIREAERVLFFQPNKDYGWKVINKLKAFGFIGGEKIILEDGSLLTQINRPVIADLATNKNNLLLKFIQKQWPETKKSDSADAKSLGSAQNAIGRPIDEMRHKLDANPDDVNNRRLLIPELIRRGEIRKADNLLRLAGFDNTDDYTQYDFLRERWKAVKEYVDLLVDEVMAGNVEALDFLLRFVRDVNMVTIDRKRNKVLRVPWVKKRLSDWEKEVHRQIEPFYNQYADPENSYHYLVIDSKELSVEVGLSRVNIPDEALQDLSNLNALTSLRLIHVPITDDGLTHLQNLSKLRRLSLFGTRITDQGLQYLNGLSSLTFLDLSLTVVTLEAAEAFLENHPNRKNLQISGENWQISGRSLGSEGLLKNLYGNSLDSIRVIGLATQEIFSETLRRIKPELFDQLVPVKNYAAAVDVQTKGLIIETGERSPQSILLQIAREAGGVSAVIAYQDEEYRKDFLHFADKMTQRGILSKEQLDNRVLWLPIPSEMNKKDFLVKFLKGRTFKLDDHGWKNLNWIKHKVGLSITDLVSWLGDQELIDAVMDEMIIGYNLPLQIPNMNYDSARVRMYAEALFLSSAVKLSQNPSAIHQEGHIQAKTDGRYVFTKDFIQLLMNNITQKNQLTKSLSAMA